jgi:hypothetical protein
MKQSGKLLLVLFLIASLTCLFGCADGESSFSGSKTGNSEQFLADFDILNTTIKSTMPLTEGEAVEVTIDTIKGVINITAQNENGTIVYQDKDADSCKSTIEIAQSGAYNFYIAGFQAKGSVHFIKSEK